MRTGETIFNGVLAQRDLFAGASAIAKLATSKKTGQLRHQGVAFLSIARERYGGEDPKRIFSFLEPLHLIKICRVICVDGDGPQGIAGGGGGAKRAVLLDVARQ